MWNESRGGIAGKNSSASFLLYLKTDEITQALNNPDYLNKTVETCALQLQLLRLLSVGLSCAQLHFGAVAC